MSEEQNLQELAALFNEHQITGEDGKLNTEAEVAPSEITAAQETETSEEQTPPAEKPQEVEAAPTQEAAADDQNELGVDDSGKRYVPESRLKKETAKFRETERELKALKATLDQGNALLQTAKKGKDSLPEPQRIVDKADILELKLTKPQFNPQSPDYNPELDEMAGKIFKATPSLSIMEAAAEAEKYANAIAQRVSTAKTEARQVKALQADQGIAGKGGQRSDTSIDPNTMTDQQLEAWLKANGQW